MRRVEATRMTDHADSTRFLLRLIDRLRIVPAVGHGNFDLDVEAGTHALNRLACMHLRRRAKNRCLETGRLERVVQAREHLGNTVLGREFLCRLETTADERCNLDTVDVLDAVEMLDAESAATRDQNLHASSVPQ